MSGTKTYSHWNSDTQTKHPRSISILKHVRVNDSALPALVYPSSFFSRIFDKNTLLVKTSLHSTGMPGKCSQQA